MIFGIIALTAAFVFTYALIHAINGKGRKEMLHKLCCHDRSNAIYSYAYSRSVYQQISLAYFT